MIIPISTWPRSRKSWTWRLLTRRNGSYRWRKLLWTPITAWRSGTTKNDQKFRISILTRKWTRSSTTRRSTSISRFRDPASSRSTSTRQVASNWLTMKICSRWRISHSSVRRLLWIIVGLRILRIFWLRLRTIRFLFLMRKRTSYKFSIVPSMMKTNPKTTNPSEKTEPHSKE